MIEAGFDGRTSAIAHGSMRILDGAGVWQGMAHAAEPIRDIRVAAGGSPLFLHYDHAEVGGSPLAYIVENRATPRALFGHHDGQDGVPLLAPCNTAPPARGPGREGGWGRGRG